MSSDRKGESSSMVGQAGSWCDRHGMRVLLLVGVLLALTALGGNAQAMQGPPDWVEELILAHQTAEDAVTLAPRVYSAAHVSRAETQEYLERLGLERLGRNGGSLLNPDVSIRGSDAFHGVLEARADWAAYRLELNGKFASRESTQVLRQAMAVTAVISSDGLRISDDRGGSRIEAYRRFPLAVCDPGTDGAGCVQKVLFDEARDDHGMIVEFIRDSQGLPSAVRFGENLLLRYKARHSSPSAIGSARAGARLHEPFSWDLIDIRRSEIVVDSVDAARFASERPVLSVFLRGFSEVLRFEGGEAFAVARGRGRPYALLPLETTSDVWRIVQAISGREHSFRVDYTDDLVRASIRTGEGDRSIVVEAPRNRESLAPALFVHPGAEMLPDAMRSGVRLRTDEPLDAWLDGAFEKEDLPIVLTPFHFEGLVPQAVRFGLIEARARAEAAVVRAAAGAEPVLQFGPAEECKVDADRVLCTGGASAVIGEVTSDPW